MATKRKSSKRRKSSTPAKRKRKSAAKKRSAPKRKRAAKRSTAPKRRRAAKRNAPKRRRSSSPRGSVGSRVPVKLRATRVKLDRGGYDDGGRYWGANSGGEKLFAVEVIDTTDDTYFEKHVRARNGREAREKITAALLTSFAQDERQAGERLRARPKRAPRARPPEPMGEQYGPAEQYGPREQLEYYGPREQLEHYGPAEQYGPIQQPRGRRRRR